MRRVKKKDKRKTHNTLNKVAQRETSFCCLLPSLSLKIYAPSHLPGSGENLKKNLKMAVYQSYGYGSEKTAVVFDIGHAFTK